MERRIASIEPGLCSVVIPVFAGERHVGQALESVKTQTYPLWEVLVVEDGSHDGTEAIVRAFAARVPERRVHFERHPANRGVSATRNTAIGKARGEYIALLDYDDQWRPGHLADSVSALRGDGADVAYCDACGLRGDSGVIEDRSCPALDGTWRRRLFFNNFIVSSSVVLRRGIFDKVGLFDTMPDIQFCEDYDLWLRLVRHGARFAKGAGNTVLYRIHATQASARLGMMYEREWLVISRHMGGYPIPGREVRRRAAQINLRNGMHFWQRDPRRARRYLWTAVRFAPGSPRHWWLAAKVAFSRSARSRT